MENNPAARFMRDARVYRIFEGPTESLRMYLGARLAKSGSALCDYLRDLWKQTEPADDLMRAVEAILERHTAEGACFADGTDARQYAHYHIGTVATWLVLEAACRHRLPTEPAQPDRDRAADWCRAQFEAALTQACHASPAERTLVTTDAMTDAIRGYEAEIGDLELAAAGEDRQFDPLLARAGDARQSSPNAPPITEPVVQPEPQSAHDTARIEAWLSAWISRELDIPASEVQREVSFLRYGMDSITGMRLSGDLEEWLEIELSSGLGWDYPNIAELAAFLAALPKRGETLEEHQVQGLLDNMDQLSGQEVDDLLRALAEDASQ
jgi:acyl carrier protein